VENHHRSKEVDEGHWRGCTPAIWRVTG
jgi:hypothetical protein